MPAAGQKIAIFSSFVRRASPNQAATKYAMPIATARRIFSTLSARPPVACPEQPLLAHHRGERWGKQIPGLNEKDLEVTSSGDVLTIRGEMREVDEQKERDAYYVERRFGSFSRSVRLPFEVADEKVDARY
jgi:hypothetical protein